ncbi:hypothetical protein B0H21DRAFT_849637 [Amylocystis lapponica]|nr:hypothetical protein B0H21DRAFT_849637 [Amylocystis lapponica]
MQQRPNDAPPPTNHILRPHHVQILRILMLTFKIYEDGSLPQPFLLHIYRVVLSEISEVTQPRTYKELHAEFLRAPMIDMPTPKKWLADYDKGIRALRTSEQFTAFFQNTTWLFSDKDDDENRRSIFGYFCRRCFVSFAKLSISAAIRLHQEYLMWTGILRIEYQIFKTKADKKQFAIPDGYSLWEKGQAVGDEQMATENLHRFFEQHFHEGNDSLLHRLPPLEHDRKAFLNDVQPGLHPFEILYDVKKLLKIANQQPLTASFEKIMQAIGLYDHWIDVQGGAFVEAEQWAQHTVQSVVWGTAGCHLLSEVEENVVTAFTEVGGDDNNRLVVTLNRAYHRAREGMYEDALAIMLEPDVWRGLTLNDYNAWANEVWHVLVLRASRRGQTRQFAEFLRQKKPGGEYMPREYWLGARETMASLVRDPLYEVMQMREVDQAHMCVDQLLTAVWHAEFQCRYGLYRSAVVMLADVALEFGMTRWSRRIVDEIMPQVRRGGACGHRGGNREQRALACFALARCVIAAGDSSPEALRESLPHLLVAEEDYKQLEILRSLQDVQYLLSVVYHNLDMLTERDAAAVRHLKTSEERMSAAAVVVEDWVADVWEVVAEVGAALAAR